MYASVCSLTARVKVLGVREGSVDTRELFLTIGDFPRDLFTGCFGLFYVC